MQDMRNRMIYFERKSVTQYHLEASSLVLIHTPPQTYQPNALFSCPWCKFCNENYDKKTFEIKKNARERIFVKRLDPIVATLD